MIEKITRTALNSKNCFKLILALTIVDNRGHVIDEHPCSSSVLNHAGIHS